MQHKIAEEGLDGEIFVQEELSTFGLVFLIEDSPTQAQYIASQLGYFGYQVEIFSNTHDALDALRQYTPLVVLTDISLPEGPLAGLDAIPEIKSLSKMPPLVVALSARTDFNTRLTAVQVGVDGYYVKPVNVPHLVEHLDRLTSKHQEEQLRVLIIDDQRAMSRIYASLFRSAGMTPTIVDEPDQVLNVMARERPDVVVCDIDMPGCSGFELASVIRQVDGNAGIPIVFLSESEAAMPMQIDALKYGGDQFLSKTMNRDWVVTVAKERAVRSRQMGRHLMCDSMTGLLKHSAIKETLTREIELARQSGKPLSYAMVDIDHFKQVNDTWGHAVGDLVIISLARLLSQNLGKADIVGRYGGEEFAVILPDSDIDQARRIMDTLRSRFAKVRHIAGHKPFNASFSCGISSFPDHDTMDDMIERADNALYQAKKSGRNKVVLAG